MRIGIIGAGQLGRMMALAGIPLGLEFAMYDRSADVPGAAVADIVTGEFDDLREARALRARRRRRHLRLGERAGRIGARDRAHPARVAAAARARGRAGPALREAASSSASASRSRRSPRSTPTRDLDARDRGARRARHPEDAPARLRRQGPGTHPPRARRRATPASASPGSRSSTSASCDFTREVSLVAARDRARRASRATRSPRTSTTNGILAVTRAPYAGRAAAARGRAQSPAPVARARLRRRALRRVFRRARPAGRERDGAARAQLRPLDHRGRRDQPVREPRARGRGPAARQPRGRAGTPSWST